MGKVDARGWFDQGNKRRWVACNYRRHLLDDADREQRGENEQATFQTQPFCELLSGDVTLD